MIGHMNNRTKGTNNAPIPEDNEQYCFRMPLELEVHKRYCSTQKRLFWFVSVMARNPNIGGKNVKDKNMHSSTNYGIRIPQV